MDNITGTGLKVLPNNEEPSPNGQNPTGDGTKKDAAAVGDGQGEKKPDGKVTGRRLQIGRPRKYKTPEEFLERAQEYLNSCYNEEGELIQPVTITGMCNYLGTTRRRLLDYEEGNLEGLKDGDGDDEGFRHAVKRVKHVCEQYAETHGFFARNPAFAIFCLKNYGWRDIQTIETTATEIHTLDPEVRQLVVDYHRQLIAAQKGLVIDVTPRKLPEPAEATCREKIYAQGSNPGRLYALPRDESV